MAKSSSLDDSSALLDALTTSTSSALAADEVEPHPDLDAMMEELMGEQEDDEQDDDQEEEQDIDDGKRGGGH